MYRFVRQTDHIYVDIFIHWSHTSGYIYIIACSYDQYNLNSNSILFNIKDGETL